MSDLSTVEKQILEKLFQMKSGYVLDFSNRTMLDFFHDDIGLNIYDEKYSHAGESKANRLRSFWTMADNKIVGKSILKLIDYIESKIAIGDFKEIDFPEKLREGGRKIGNKLSEKEAEKLEIKPETNLSKEIGRYLKKAEDEIKNEDYDGAIGTLSTFLEEFFEELHTKLTGESLGESADFKSDFAKIKHLLNLAPDGHADQKIKQILVGFSQIVDALDRLCNTMGDRHRKLKDEEGNIRFKPLKHHAVLMLNSVKTLTWFLFNSYEYQIERKENLEKELLNILSSDSKKLNLVQATKDGNRLFNCSFDDIQNNKFVKRWLTQSAGFINKYLIKKNIQEYVILSRDQNNKFFAIMKVLYNDLTIQDVEHIYKKWMFSKNDQSYGLGGFINDLIKNKIEIVPEYIQKEVEVLNISKSVTFSCLFDTLVHPFYGDGDSENFVKEAKKIKLAIKGKENELITIVDKYFSGFMVGDKNYTQQIKDFILSKEKAAFSLPDSAQLINEVIAVIQKFPGDNIIFVGDKKFGLSDMGIIKLEKIYTDNNILCS